MKIKKIRRFLLIVILFIVLVVALFSIGNVIIKIGQNPTGEAKVVSEIKAYNYKLEDNETKYYNSLFGDLKNELDRKDVADEKYAALIAKLFVADFYNLDNKVSKNDIGGLQFVHSAIKDNFILNAKNTLYKYVENNIYGNRDQELPVVKSVNISNIEKISYTYGTKKDLNAYQLGIEWDYKKDLGYQKEATMVIIHEDNKLSIVELK